MSFHNSSADDNCVPVKMKTNAFFSTSYHHHMTFWRPKSEEEGWGEVEVPGTRYPSSSGSIRKPSFDETICPTFPCALNKLDTHILSGEGMRLVFEMKISAQSLLFRSKTTSTGYFFSSVRTQLVLHFKMYGFAFAEDKHKLTSAPIGAWELKEGRGREKERGVILFTYLFANIAYFATSRFPVQYKTSGGGRGLVRRL